MSEMFTLLRCTASNPVTSGESAGRALAASEKFDLCRNFRPILPQSSAIKAIMRTIVVIFILALITIAAAIYSDVILTGADVSQSQDPATSDITHALKRG
jgi:hypothetical protein